MASHCSGHLALTAAALRLLGFKPPYAPSAIAERPFHRPVDRGSGGSNRHPLYPTYPEGWLQGRDCDGNGRSNRRRRVWRRGRFRDNLGVKFSPEASVLAHPVGWGFALLPRCPHFPEPAGNSTRTRAHRPPVRGLWLDASPHARKSRNNTVVRSRLCRTGLSPLRELHLGGRDCAWSFYWVRPLVVFVERRRQPRTVANRRSLDANDQLRLRRRTFRPWPLFHPAYLKRRDLCLARHERKSLRTKAAKTILAPQAFLPEGSPSPARPHPYPP
jgi:hypothetical protein